MRKPTNTQAAALWRSVYIEVMRHLMAQRAGTWQAMKQLASTEADEAVERFNARFEEAT